MNNWEYLLVPLGPSDQPTPAGGESSVGVLNQAGLKGWEAVGVTILDGGKHAVLMKRELKQQRQSGGR